MTHLDEPTPLLDEPPPEPWYKRVWPFFVALGVGFLGALVALKGRAALSEAEVRADQEEANRRLDERLVDKKRIVSSEMEAVSSEKRALIEKTDRLHGEHDHKIEKEVDEAEKALIENPHRLPKSLIDTMNNADRTLRGDDE